MPDGPVGSMNGTAILDPPKSYIEGFMDIVFKYRKLQPPDELTREIVYRLLRQKIAPLTVVEHNNHIYIVCIQKGDLLAFRIRPPKEEDEEKKFRGWAYKTVRNLKEIPIEVLRAGVTDSATATGWAITSIY